MRLFSSLFNRRVKSGLCYFFISTKPYDNKITTPYVYAGFDNIVDALVSYVKLQNKDDYVLVHATYDSFGITIKPISLNFA